MTQFRAVMKPDVTTLCRAMPSAPLVEAFPNTFLGLLLPAAAFNFAIKPRTRARSDQLYEAVRDQGLLDRHLDHLGWMEDDIRTRFREEKDHDLRAAHVCLLTTGFASAGTATVVGDETGG